MVKLILTMSLSTEKKLLLYISVATASLLLLESTVTISFCATTPVGGLAFAPAVDAFRETAGK